MVSTTKGYQFCRDSGYGATLTPSHGTYVGASSKPFDEYARKRGDKTGFHWRIPTIKGKRTVRHVLFDTNYWKTFVHHRMSVAMGDRSCLSLYKGQPSTHRMFAEHFTAEYRVRTEGRGRVVDEWKEKPNKPDNHLFDCVVGCAVAASMLGVRMVGQKVERQRPRVNRADRRERVQYL